MTSEWNPQTSSGERIREQLIDDLLAALGRTFRLDYEVSAGALGSLLHARLEQLDLEAPPTWGEPGSISQVAKLESASLDFYYRPHLFPGMEPQLRLAHHLQFDLLPRELPDRSPLAIAAVLESYCHLSGDLLGWRASGDTIFLWIADISGHGVRAGLAAAVLHFLMEDLDPAAPLGVRARRLNERMAAARNPDDPRALYMTTFFLEIDGAGTGTYTAAGHPPMLQRRADGSIVRLEALGPPVGLLEGTDYPEGPLALDADDALFLYTDGLLEARSDSDEEFGLARIEAVLGQAPDEPLGLSRAVYAAVGEHKESRLLDDDLTFLAARRQDAVRPRSTD